ncbi:hypothetical protein Pan241w_58890 [Gimesia alba]|uniref:Methyltransferase domain-containing protein n=1 Tax=Gimesia alba TaxID=2527973 RepID=A0A517RPE3_9PLAN|nr:class I SAM-dependent methyltransferase [Gimesia alba]QDT45761.1 hypothetical protein Pan241w_58890 [Gimesia alba]
MKQVFEEIHDQNLWGSPESVSGTGSTLEQTRVIRDRLPDLIERFRIESMLDLPCGDFNWMHHVRLNLDYIGADIIEAIISRNSAVYDHEFCVLDITSSSLRTVDLVFCRDCLVHLSDADVLKAIARIKASGSKYLLTTTFPDRVNRDIQTGFWRPINLQAEPFCFPDSVEIINEGCTEFGGEFKDKSLALFELTKVQSADR